MNIKIAAILFVALATQACSEPNLIVVKLAPDVVSSIDGRLTVRATAFDDAQVAQDESITFSVEYKDRSGVVHAVEPIVATTDVMGSCEATFSGLTWDGTGTVTATLGGNAKLTGVATFSVLDRTPPTVAITPPTQIRRDVDTTITVLVKDETGVSQVWLQTDFDGNNGNNNNNRGRLVANGTTDTQITFDIKTQAPVGTTLRLYALAADLSGNLAAAIPVMVTVAQ